MLSDHSQASVRGHSIQFGLSQSGIVESLDYDMPTASLGAILGERVVVSQSANHYRELRIFPVEVHDSKVSLLETWLTISMPDPPSAHNFPVESDRRLRPRSIHFTQAGKCLIVTYLNHGIMYVGTRQSDSAF